MAKDDYKGSHDRTDPIVAAVVVDLSAADAVLTDVTRGVYLGVAGDLKVDMLEGPSNPVTLPNMAAGYWHPIRISKIYKVGTTADQIVAGW